MKTNKKILYLFILVLFSSCNIPKMLIDDNLRLNADSYKVNGSSGLQFNQQISFGDFKTGKVNRGWRTAWKSSFIFDKVEAKQKINFDVIGKTGETAVVSCAAKYQEKDLNLFSKKLSFPISHENTYAGSIVSTEMAWEFIVSKQKDFNMQACLAGEMFDLKNKLEIYEVHSFGDKYKTATADVVGYELKMGGLSVAAVQVLNGGYVWIRSGLPEKNRLPIAAMCAALLLKPNLDQ